MEGNYPSQELGTQTDLVGYGKVLWGCRNFTGIYVQEKQGVSKCTKKLWIEADLLERSASGYSGVGIRKPR